MGLSESLLEIKEYKQEGYSPVIDFGQWRVAVLNYCDELLPWNISKMQRHDETDEVFVLLKGEFVLYIGEGVQEIGKIHAVKLEPYKMYNVKRGVWHTHTLSRDASVLIVENRSTGPDNSTEMYLGENQRKQLEALIL